MKADFTRISEDPFKHFSRVLMQQGRVQIDADWNEQAGILLRYLRILAKDIIGPFGGRGMPVAKLVIGGNAVPGDFAIVGGDYYVDGILCELGGPPVAITSIMTGNAQTTVQVAVWTIDGDSFATGEYVQVFDDSDAPVAPQIAKITNTDYKSMTLTLNVDLADLSKAQNPRIHRLLTYLNQPDFPVPSATGPMNALAPAPLQQGDYQVFFDVWERLITYVEDDSIREVALNGPDTCARARVVAQVRVMKPIQPQTCMSALAISQVLQPWNRGLLRAQAKPPTGTSDPCTISPDAQYRGPENQLYRVEINTGSKDINGNNAKPTFKWSRENGSVVFPIVSGGGTNSVTLENLGRDQRFSLAPGDWVEMQDDESVLCNYATALLRVESINQSLMVLTLTGTPDPTVGSDVTKHPLMRRWDYQAGDSAAGGLELGTDNAALIPAGTSDIWLDLEDGIQIQFVKPAASHFRTGDYWLIPARVATGDIIWPKETITDSSDQTVTNPVALPPDGINHHYAPLAIISVNGSNTPTVEKPCWETFSQLAKANPPA